jgi:type I restriction enzyme S subunit
MSFESAAWLPLTDVVEEIIDRRGVTPLKLGGNFESEGHRVISAKLLKDRTVQLDADEARFVNGEIYKKWMKLPLQAGDVIMTSEAPLGELAYLNEDKDWVLGQRLFAIRPRKNLMSGRFLYYVLQTATVRSDIQGRATGTTVQGIRQAELRLVKVPVPSLADQNEAASFLGALDDSITLLRETNKTLEAIAQAIFKSWFIDFDPVRAKMGGLVPAGLDEETAALFPDELVESELGLVPKGWEVIPFRSAIEVIGGGTPKTSVDEYWGGDIPWFSVVDAPNQSDVFVIDTEKKITAAGLNGSSTKLLPVGTTIISARGTVGKIALTGCEMAMNQSCYGLRGRAIDRYFTYFSTAKLVNQLKKNAHGSVFDTITQETFSGVQLAYPSHSLINAYENFVDPMMMKIRSNLYQVNTLAEMRDSLLPRLISGRLRLSGCFENVA